MPVNTKFLSQVTRLSMIWAKEAGDILLDCQKKLSTLKVSSKKAQGFVSSADIASENHLTKKIRKHFPDHRVLAEESAFKEFGGKAKGYAHFKEIEWCWLIDPLDGTHNFLNAFDYYCVSICLAHYGMPVAAVIYRPSTDEMFFAIKGQGANYKKGKNSWRKIRPSRVSKKVKECLFVTGFASEKGVMLEREFKLFKRMMEEGRGIRRMGSAALDLSYVALGTFDAFWERGLAPWDVGAAGLICREAGLLVTDYAALPFHPFQETILAARSGIHNKIVKHFK